MTARPPESSLRGPAWLRGGHIPSLDGLRGVAVGLVVISHAMGTVGFPLSRAYPLWEAWNLIGRVGVSVFFVLSGFLITLLLLREREQAAEISVTRFYIRRALRILPAFVAYLAVVLAATLAGHIVAAARDWVLALTYTGSILPQKRWEFVHLWSLSIEEQFYLVWPWILVLLAQSRAATVAILCVAGSVLSRLAVLLYFPDYVWWIDFFTFTRLECIAVGCLLALATTKPGFLKFSRDVTERLPWVGALAAVALVVWYSLTTPSWAARLFAMVGVGSVPAGLSIAFEATKHLGVALLVAIVLWSTANQPGRGLGKLLGWRPLALLGTVSYSLYLWQQFFLNWDATGWIYEWPQNLVAAVLVAAASYVLIERPFLRLKSRWGSDQGQTGVRPWSDPGLTPSTERAS